LERQYAPAETDLRKFVVEGEQHYWVYVAIDRFTGQVLLWKLYQLIVIFVAANPHPLDDVPHQLSDGTMMIAYPD
jgi:hypothetical protein